MIRLNWPYKSGINAIFERIMADYNLQVISYKLYRTLKRQILPMNLKIYLIGLVVCTS